MQSPTKIIRQRNSLVTLIVIFTVMFTFAIRTILLRYGPPPDAHTVIVWVHWPDEIRGHYELTGDHAQEFIDFAWKNTQPGDFYDVAQYRTINFFCLDSGGKVTRGVYIRAGRENQTFNAIEKIAAVAAHGRKLKDYEEIAMGPQLRHRLHETHRIYID